jgi:hypothetical protein
MEAVLGGVRPRAARPRERAAREARSMTVRPVTLGGVWADLSGVLDGLGPGGAWPPGLPRSMPGCVMPGVPIGWPCATLDRSSNCESGSFAFPWSRGGWSGSAENPAVSGDLGGPPRLPSSPNFRRGSARGPAMGMSFRARSGAASPCTARGGPRNRSPRHFRYSGTDYDS